MVQNVVRVQPRNVQKKDPNRGVKNLNDCFRRVCDHFSHEIRVHEIRIVPVRKVQSVINTFFQSPIMGLGVFLTVAGLK